MLQQKERGLMGDLLNIVTALHKKTKRNYLERMTDDKVACSKIARNYGKEYWDGNRRFGYGGYKYDGRWETVARKLIERYKLPENASILDVGCGKGYLLYEFQKLLPQAKLKGFDISKYAVENAKEEIKTKLFVHRAQDPYPFKDKEFDLVISITTLHNLYANELKQALQEMERVGRNKYIVVESYRNEEELFNLQCWALTCNSFFTPDEWGWLFKEFGYTGDYEFIYFE
jgi:SAM-dependent methyltransferase